jgi:hypothetical protein
MVTQTPSTQRVKQFLLDHPNSSPQDIGRACGIQHNTAVKDMFFLKRAGMVFDKLRVNHEDKTYHYLYRIVNDMVAI